MHRISLSRKMRWAFVVASAVLLACIQGCFGPTTPLGKAVGREDLSEVKAQLAKGADPCAKAGRGSYSSLDLAMGDIRELLKSDEIKMPIYQPLLENAYERAMGGYPCDGVLFYAARVGDVEKIKALLARGNDPNQNKEEWEASPLGIAAYYGHGDAAAALVRGGADVDQQLFNFEKYRLWAVSIGKQTGYLRADKAIRLLRKYESEQRPKPQQ